LLTLTFSYSYGKKFGKNVLPSSLQSLTLGRNFSQIIDKNTLPNSLNTLIFSGHYEYKVNINVLPTSLKSIVFDYDNNALRDKTTVIPSKFHDIVKHINYAVEAY
jgi:hypothetical protein